MSKEEGKIVNWKQIIITALITATLSLVVGYVLVVMQNKEQKLTYEVVEKTIFNGDKESSLIYSVVISNKGKVYIENVQGLLEVARGNIEDFHFDISRNLNCSILSKPNSIEFTIPYLNPSEQFTISLIASDPSVTPEVKVDLRGSGVVGVNKERNNSFASNLINNIISMGILIPLVYGTKEIFRIFEEKKH